MPGLWGLLELCNDVTTATPKTPHAEGDLMMNMGDCKKTWSIWKELQKKCVNHN